MLNNSAVEYWSKQPTDQPWLLNGFTGTFAYSDHRKIPEGILEFLLEYFYKRLGDARKHHIKSIELDEINALMNDVWDGPGSMFKIAKMTQDMRMSRLDIVIDDAKDPLKGYDTPTVDSHLSENVVDRLET